MRRAGICARFFTERRVDRRSQRIIDRDRRFTLGRSEVFGPDRQTAVTRLLAGRQESRFREWRWALRDTSLEFANGADARLERRVEWSTFDRLFTRRKSNRRGR